MRTFLQVPITVVMLLIAAGANAQSSSPASPAVPGAVPLSELIASVAKRTGKRFVVDRRAAVSSVSLIGEDFSRVSYDQLLTILNINGFAAAEGGGYVNIVPDALIRSQPLPLISDKDKLPEGEYVTRIIRARSLSAAQLVPILRPLIPPQGHLSALPCANSLIIVDRFANVRRIEAIIKTLDVGAPVKPSSCSDRGPE